ncbi:hypothetical protein BKA93DRAFT_876743 [Sparassis latifolia]
MDYLQTDMQSRSGLETIYCQITTNHAETHAVQNISRLLACAASSVLGIPLPGPHSAPPGDQGVLVHGSATVTVTRRVRVRRWSTFHAVRAAVDDSQCNHNRVRPPPRGKNLGAGSCTAGGRPGVVGVARGLLQSRRAFQRTDRSTPETRRVADAAATTSPSGLERVSSDSEGASGGRHVYCSRTSTPAGPPSAGLNPRAASPALSASCEGTPSVSPEDSLSTWFMQYGSTNPAVSDFNIAVQLTGKQYCRFIAPVGELCLAAHSSAWSERAGWSVDSVQPLLSVTAPLHRQVGTGHLATSLYKPPRLYGGRNCQMPISWFPVEYAVLSIFPPLTRGVAYEMSVEVAIRTPTPVSENPRSSEARSPSYNVILGSIQPSRVLLGVAGCRTLADDDDEICVFILQVGEQVRRGTVTNVYENTHWQIVEAHREREEGSSKKLHRALQDLAQIRSNGDPWSRRGALAMEGTTPMTRIPQRTNSHQSVCAISAGVLQAGYSAGGLARASGRAAGKRSE